MEVDCSALLLGQFLCNATGMIDPETQQPFECGRDGVAKMTCTAVEGLICRETGNRTFTRDLECKWTNGYSYSTALLLSVFLGVFGADRWYLGHPATAALKFFTLGFMFVGQLVDIILIATGNLRPIDDSNLIMSYYGPGVQVLRSSNESYIVGRSDWFTGGGGGTG